MYMSINVIEYINYSMYLKSCFLFIIVTERNIKILHWKMIKKNKIFHFMKVKKLFLLKKVILNFFNQCPNGPG